MANGVVVSSGTTYTVPSGQTDTNDIVMSGGSIVVSGVIINTAVSGTEILLAGGMASSSTVSVFGVEIISSGGSANGSTLFAATQTVLAGGTATSATLVGGIQNLSGTAIGTTVSSGSEQDVFAGGTASGTTIRPAGKEVVFSGATAS